MAGRFTTRRRSKDFVPLSSDDISRYREEGKSEERIKKIFKHEAKENLVALRTEDKYRGDWLPNTGYDQGDQVTYGTNLYFATRNSRNIRPNMQSHWKQMAGSSPGGGGGAVKIKPHKDVDLTAIILPPSTDIVWPMDQGWIAHLTLDANNNAMGDATGLTAHSSGKLYLNPNNFTPFTWSAMWDWNGSPPDPMPTLGKGLIIAWDCPDGAKLVCGLFAEYTI